MIDTDEHTFWSKYLGTYLDTTKSPSNLMLLDINQLWRQEVSRVQDIAQVQESSPTHSHPGTVDACQKIAPAADTSSWETEHEQRFKRRLSPESNLIQTNLTDSVRLISKPVAVQTKLP